MHWWRRQLVDAKNSVLHNTLTIGTSDVHRGNMLQFGAKSRALFPDQIGLGRITWKDSDHPWVKSAHYDSNESDGHLTVLEVLTNNYFHKQLFCQLFFQLIDESQFKRKKIRPKFPSLNYTITEHNFRLTVKKKKHKYSVTGSVCNVQY